MSPTEKFAIVVAAIIGFSRLYAIVNDWVKETVARRNKHTRVGW